MLSIITVDNYYCDNVFCTKAEVKLTTYIYLIQDFHDPMFDSGPKKLIFERMMSDTPLLMSPQLDNWEIPANEVIMEKLLGEGAFGEVYKGVVKCPIVNPKVKLSAKNPICTPVAIKLLKCE